jgi:hypothetical protein
MPRFVIRQVTWSIAWVTVSNDDNEGVSALQRNLGHGAPELPAVRLVPGVRAGATAARVARPAGGGRWRASSDQSSVKI